ncbi:MAG: ribonuclease Y [Candidatus Edwardsbacteria bacterium]
MDLQLIIYSLLGLVIISGGMFVLGYLLHKRLTESRLASAEKAAQRIVAEAQKEAETYKKTAILETKEEWYKAKAQFEKETQSRRQELQQLERKVTEREGHLDRKIEILNKKERELENRERILQDRERTVRAKDERLTKLVAEQNIRLEQIAGMTQEEAKRHLLDNLEAQARLESAQLIKEIKDKAKEQAEKEAKEIITLAVQRYASEHTAESTVTLVPLANDEMKGRIIGREGRNIRAFESATGVEALIDDTPEAIVISGFDPIRREIAKIAMEKLISDGRIQPTRIEETVGKAREELEKRIKEIGEGVCLELGIVGLHPELVKLLGKLKFRTSYGQNVLQHSKEVAWLASAMAGELELDATLAKRAGLLHDIGKAVDQTVEGTHAQIGVELVRKYGESLALQNAIAAHHEDVEATSLISVLIAAADAISGARPGARRETLETYIKRMEKLEELTSSFQGVEKAYAIQAGREVRIMVVPEEISDTALVELADQIAKKIQDELQYPGQIKVTVIRETRGVSYAK